MPKNTSSKTETVELQIQLKPLYARALKPQTYYVDPTSETAGWCSAQDVFEQSSDNNKVSHESLADQPSGLVLAKEATPAPFSRSEETTGFSLLTYNVWGAPQDSSNPYFQFDKRSEAILTMIAELSPDVICLQEVSVEWANAILENDYIRATYFSTDGDIERIKSLYGLSQITLSKFPIVSIGVYGLPGYEMSTMLNTHIQLGHSEESIVSVSNIHLHSSKEYTPFRIAQLKIVQGLLESERAENKIIAGDFNFGDGENWTENNHIKPTYEDCWLKLFSTAPGYTEDTTVNTMRYKMKGKSKQERFDKVLSAKDNTFECTSMELVGTESIEGTDEIWPSDHFGILSHFAKASSEKPATKRRTKSKHFL